MKTFKIIFFLVVCYLESWSLNSEIHVNQLGYFPDGKKYFSVNDTSLNTFKVLDYSNGEIVFSGTLGKSKPWSLSEEDVQLGEFSELKTEGKYVILVEGMGESFPFRIRSDLYSQAFAGIARSFMFQRASMAIPEKNGGMFARESGHPDTNLLFHSGLKKDAGATWSSPKGWYDAGDYGKYIVNAGFSLWYMLTMVEEFPQLSTDGSMNIPESGNQKNDLLDEIKWEIDWFFTMQDVDGGVFFKVTPLNFSGTKMPEVETKQRYVIGKSIRSTLVFAATMAHASRTWKGIDDIYSDSCLKAAEKAWDWAKSNPDAFYSQPSDVKTGPYTNKDASDEFFWAATELLLTTGNTNAYLQSVTSGIPKELAGMNWANVGPLGVYTLALSESAQHADLKLSASTLIKTRAEKLITEIEAHPYRIYNEKYNWGSNGNIASTGVELGISWLITNESKYLDGASGMGDYLFGQNPLSISFLTGFGSNYTLDPHHRPMEADKIDSPIPGFLAGGANAQGGDNVLKALVASGCPAAKCYVDVAASYASNEIAINWQAPILLLTGLLESELGKTKTVSYNQVGPFELTYTVSGAGKITVTPAKDNYSLGDTVTLKAIPETGHAFISWNRNQGTQDELQIIIHSDTYINASFDDPSTERVKNGDFSDSLNWWNPSQDAEPYPNVYAIHRDIVEDGKLKVDVQFDGGTIFSNSVQQEGLVLLGGEKYVFRLKGSSDTNRALVVKLAEGSTIPLNKRFYLDKDGEDIVIGFAASKSILNGTLTLYFGAEKVDFSLDDISILKVETLPEDQLGPVSLVKLFDLKETGISGYWNQGLFVESQEAMQVNIRLVNLGGKTIWSSERYLQAGKNKVGVSALPTGIYHLVVQKNRMINVSRIIVQN